MITVKRLRVRMVIAQHILILRLITCGIPYMNDYIGEVTYIIYL